MTGEERQKCSWLFHVFTGETIEPHQWNDQAVAALYEMTRQIKHCSVGLAFIPTVAPKTSNPASYLVTYVVDVLKKELKLLGRETTVIEACRKVAIYRGWAREVKRQGIGVD